MTHRRRHLKTYEHAGYKTGPNARPRSSVGFDEDIYMQVKNLSERKNISFAHAVNQILRIALKQAGRLS